MGRSRADLNRQHDNPILPTREKHDTMGRFECQDGLLGVNIARNAQIVPVSTNSIM
jgi:hypothetical protein